ncbi:dipeptide/oligopeptide/nickel ABC transporter permease/ATP-binding protein [Microbacterium aerolatum]|uniref:Dipeptide/oligopeptide/nickel ABC transporter ATP-binding protein n=1 Tax=Microbacterium aerolatum TaxID=153731 RepID=A0A511AHC4_9MICO|nr:dipeptide/oligopeptide/nickel ABC transporter permease/ATP-binding protein [Microbacterium aerolatum]GEK87426.1 dipeptide/oligopeptide/nickel ABC transporter ATP-binding protein [Microbacterium aerolatum]GGB33459.1 dipeptide/oligopeptide/nickel ABC transporter ATP-binding protein [Microbacterium aerolatum]
MTTTDVYTTPVPQGPPTRRKNLFRRLIGNTLGVICLTYLAALALVAVVGPFIVPFDPNAADIGNVLSTPSAEHLLGGDSAGRDVLSRLVVASSISLAGALVTVIVAAVIGIPTGLIAGYYGGWFDNAAAWLAGLVMALPALVVLLAVRAVVGPSIWLVMAIFGVLISPSFYRVVSGAVRAVREELYIDAAKVAGLGNVRVIGRHVLTAVRAPAILLVAGIFSVGVGVQAIIDFLGLGDTSLPSWGGMLSEGFYNIFRAPALMIWPALAIGLTCIALTLLGTALRDEMEFSGGDRNRSRSEWSAPHPRADAPMVHANGNTTPAPLLQITDLAVAYPKGAAWSTVVDGVSLSVAAGEVHALIGESGSGKTQTAWATLGLLPAGGRIVGGTVTFDGQQRASTGSSQVDRLLGRHIGYVPQEPLSNLDPSYTIGHQLIEPMRAVMGMAKAEARDRSQELLIRVGIDDPERVMASYPHEISGGMAQRILIAGAISCKPALVIADEPTTALDVTVQAEVLQLLRELQQELGLAVLLVTHNFGVVADLADRVSVMRAGAVVETGTVTDVFADPQHSYTRSLFAALLDGAPTREPWAPRAEAGR